VAVDLDAPGAELIDYVNVPPLLGMLQSSRPEYVGPLHSVLGTEDLHDLLEIIVTDAHNQRLLAKANKDK
jgi:hypothetical protein